MPRNIWLWTDPHLFHKNILEFEDAEGKLIRGNLFDNVEQMNDCILTHHNECVKPGDISYCLGDLTFKYDDVFLSFFAKFHGTKRLIPGNHDNIKKLTPLFKKVQSWRVFKDVGIPLPFTASHFPIDGGSIKGVCNVHGHTHQNSVPGSKKHLNICPEIIGYKPKHIDEIQEMIRELQN